MLRTYEILKVGDMKKVVKKREDPTEEYKLLVPYEDLFECLNRCHKNIGHKGRDLMLKECSKMHINLTVEAITCNLSINNKK